MELVTQVGRIVVAAVLVFVRDRQPHPHVGVRPVWRLLPQNARIGRRQVVRG